MSQAEEQQIRTTTTHLLQNNRGLFVGETHDRYVSSNFVISQLQAWKAQGLTTVYVELSMYRAAAAQGGQECLDNFWGPDSTSPNSPRKSGVRELVEAATAMGIRVIGYDSFNGHGWVNGQLRADPNLIAKIATGPEQLEQRNNFAVEVIRQTDDGGKFVVYGGNNHSANYEHVVSGQGLSDKLGIPSVAFRGPWNSAIMDSPNVISVLGSAAAVLWDKTVDSVTGGSTLRMSELSPNKYVVTTADDNAFFSPTIYRNAPDEKARLEQAKRQAEEAGLCTLPAHLEHQFTLSNVDLGNLNRVVEVMNKPETPNQESVPPR